MKHPKDSGVSDLWNVCIFSSGCGPAKTIFFCRIGRECKYWKKKKKQREANSSAGKECTVGSISLQARELTTLGEFRIPGKGSWQPHSSAAVRTNQGASVLAPHLVLALQVTAKQPADKTQKLLYSIEHKMPVLITSSFIRNQYRSEDTQPKSAINISSVHVK